ncbi:MAG: dihydropteroate synthase [Spirochaetales bacterium]|nr:dihydropteroate synthase [Spirochaetales bacterium]
MDTFVSPKIMGIINTTPDSFYSPSRAESQEAIDRGMKMIDEGADILDIGGESTRPGSAYTSVDEELRRVIPVLEGLRPRTRIPLSLDTRKYEVALAGLDAGAQIINDVSALEDDPRILPLLAERGAKVVLMHKQGTPQTMQQNPHYKDPVIEVGDYLIQRAQHVLNGGVLRENIILDPGIGFGKTFEHNMTLIKELHSIVTRVEQYCAGVLLGYSRKGFLGTLLAEPEGQPRGVDDRLFGGLGVGLWAVAKGARYLRVHDVKATKDALKVWWSISSQ